MLQDHALLQYVPMGKVLPGGSRWPCYHGEGFRWHPCNIPESGAPLTLLIPSSVFVMSEAAPAVAEMAPPPPLLGDCEQAAPECEQAVPTSLLTGFYALSLQVISFLDS